MIWLLLACREATPYDACAVDPAWCLTCASDADCHWTGNPCTESVWCAHEDASIAVTQIGCDPITEYRWPEPEACACVADRCSAESSAAP